MTKIDHYKMPYFRRSEANEPQSRPTQTNYIDATRYQNVILIRAPTSAAAAYEKSAAGREALVSALRDLRGSLDPHLRREEDDMMPIVATTSALA